MKRKAGEWNRMDIETQMIEYMRPLFGDMAEKAMENQKNKLGIRKKATVEDYRNIAEAIRELCKNMAGEAISERIYSGLVQILDTKG
jgi:hypothetical protein